jgi:4-diphosphocytidyl-2-C-methyl-D-erythritol kinase
VNTFLSVGPPDRRRYHPIRTIFQAVGLFDHLEMRLADRDEFECNVALPEDNTVFRTVRLLREVANVPPLALRLEKSIPSESGFGGGSSDAAGVIRGVLALVPQPVPEKELQFVASTVGADVPFFLVGGRAIGEGYGEILRPLPDPEPAWMVLARPEIGCSTPEMYAKLDSVARQWAPLPEDLDLAYNDFERVAPCECLELIDRLASLGARRAGLSGSGSGVWASFPTRGQAEEAAALANAPHAWVAPLLTRRESLETQ